MFTNLLPLKSHVFRVVLWTLISTFALILTGCGGGGGGGAVTTDFVYSTDWTGASTGAVTGQSQKVSLIDADGKVVASSILNSNSSTQELKFKLPSTGCHVRAELNSGNDFSGTVTGITEGDAVSGTTMRSAVGPAASTIALPSGTLVEAASSKRLYATTASTDGKCAFVAPTGIVWEVTGSAATIAPDGTLTGVNPGEVSVKAKLASNGQSASTSVSIIVTGAKKSKWTVLVFLNAANTLYPYANPNVDQMERVASKDVRFVLQWKFAKNLYPNSGFNGTRRYLVTPNNDSGVASEMVQDLGTGVDMGRPEALKDFIAWGKANYPAERYAVIIWSHGNGWSYPGLSIPVRATSFDDEFVSAIRVWELPTAFAGQRMDIVGFDACLMQMMEIASDLRPFADYIVGSEENTPAPGYPYDRVFGAFKSDPNASTEELAKSFVTGHIGNPAYKNEAVTQSVISSKGILRMETAVDALARSLIDNRSKLLGIIPDIRANARSYGTPGDGLNYFDLCDIATRIKAAAVPTAVKTAAQQVLDAKSGLVVASDARSYNSFSQGIAIDFSPSTNKALVNYPKLQLAKSTMWDEWLAVAP